MDTTPDDTTAPPEPQYPPPQARLSPDDPTEQLLHNMTVTLAQARKAAQTTEEKHQADLQQLRNELLGAQAQQQAAQAADLR